MLHVRNSSQKLSDVQHCSRVISGICSTNPADGALPEGVGSGLPSSSCPRRFWWGTFADLPCESALLLVPFWVGVRGSCKQYFHLCLDSSEISSDADSNKCQQSHTLWSWLQILTSVTLYACCLSMCCVQVPSARRPTHQALSVCCSDAFTGMHKTECSGETRLVLPIPTSS